MTEALTESLLRAWTGAQTLLAGGRDWLDDHRRDERGEGVISAAIAVMIMAFLGAAMWLAFKGIFDDAVDVDLRAGQRDREVTRGPAAAPLRGDRGAGLVATVTGACTFLAFVLFAAQLCLHLRASSTVGAVTADAASLVAPGAADPAAAEARARDLLGRTGDEATFDWSASTDGFVVLHVSAPSPGVVGAIPGLDEVDRTVRVRREQVVA